MVTISLTKFESQYLFDILQETPKQLLETSEQIVRTALIKKLTVVSKKYGFNIDYTPKKSKKKVKQ